MVRVMQGDMLTVLPTLDADSVHSVVTDPPYHLGEVPHVKKGGFGGARDDERRASRRGFMGKAWDGGDIASRQETWAEVLRVMKPGAHLVAFGGTRTWHRMACAIEDAGFEIRDTLCWLYGTGFPKSHDLSKAIDKAAGVEREVVGVTARRVGHGESRALGGLCGTGTFRENPNQPGNLLTAPATPEAALWSGWGTALKPAFEPIILARKPVIGTVAANVLLHRCGGLNIDACRVAINADVDDPRLGGAGTWEVGGIAVNAYGDGWSGGRAGSSTLGRWPANVVHDGSDEIMAAFAAFGDKSSTRANGNPNDPIHGSNGSGTSYEWGELGRKSIDHRDTGTAARFFYCAKASRKERDGSKHPTVKPLALMSWLVNLVTPPGGIVLDPFAGSGSTLVAARRLGFDAIGIEREAEYVADIDRRLKAQAGLFWDIADG